MVLTFLALVAYPTISATVDSMYQRYIHVFFGMVFLVAPLQSAFSVQFPTTDDIAAPTPNRPDEPFSREYSLDRATDFLDTASLHWQKHRKCMTCHTNYAFLYARPGISSNSPAHKEVRRFAEQLVLERWVEKGPRWDAEVVATAAGLAFNDSATTGELHPATRQALERMWTVQREDGGFSWLKCGWPPMESDDHYGVTLAAIAVGVAPGEYAKSPAAKNGLEKIRKFLNLNPPPTVHHQAMLLWASRYLDKLITKENKDIYIERLLSLQKSDGGWALATLGNWKRADGKQQNLETSDGYGTGFVIYALRSAEMPADSPAIQRGIRWLKSHQRQSGRWFTRSLNKDNKHYISHAGTAMAILALSACDQLR